MKNSHHNKPEQTKTAIIFVAIVKTKNVSINDSMSSSAAKKTTGVMRRGTAPTKNRRGTQYNKENHGNDGDVNNDANGADYTQN